MTISRTEQLVAEKDGTIGWITFNNPARHNAMSMAMWEALADVVDDYGHDSAIRVIVVKGAGDKAFVSGADISEFKEKRSSPETVRIYNKAAGTANDSATIAVAKYPDRGSPSLRPNSKITRKPVSGNAGISQTRSSIDVSPSTRRGRRW